MGGNTRFFKGSQPASLVTVPLAAFAYAAGGVGFGLYGKLVRGYAFPWLMAAALPAVVLGVVMGNRQDETLK